MKKLLFILSFLVTFNLYSQNDGLEICFEYQKVIKGFSSDKKADEALKKILDVIGASKNFSLVRCDEINNALAVTYKGERYILYDSNFFKMLEELSNDWSSLFILSHEVGHHINGHTRDFLISNILDDISLDERRIEELEADEFAGFILANLGAKFQDIEELIDVIGVKGDDSFSTHPSKDKRLLSAKKGFDRFEPKIEIVNKSNSYNKIEYNKSGNWESDLLTREFWKEYYLGLGYDPIESASRSLSFGVISKTISSVGYSYDGNEKIKLNIKFDKFNNIWGISDYKLNERGPQWAESRFAHFKIRNGISYMMEFTEYMNPPKFTFDKDLAEEFPDYNFEIIEEWTGFEARVSYMIDDTVQGHFFAYIRGYERGNSPTLPFKIGTLKSERIKDPNYKKPSPVTSLEIDIGRNWGPDDFEYLHNNFLKFIEGIKNGKTLYMRIENRGYATYESKFQTYNNLIKPTTYVFDLKGSSKAIGQYKGDL